MDCTYKGVVGWEGVGGQLEVGYSFQQDYMWLDIGKPTKMSHLAIVYFILLAQLTATFIHCPWTVALTGLADWSAFLDIYIYIWIYICYVRDKGMRRAETACGLKYSSNSCIWCPTHLVPSIKKFINNSFVVTVCIITKTTKKLCIATYNCRAVARCSQLVQPKFTISTS